MHIEPFFSSCTGQRYRNVVSRISLERHQLAGAGPPVTTNRARPRSLGHPSICDFFFVITSSKAYRSRIDVICYVGRTTYSYPTPPCRGPPAPDRGIRPGIEAAFQINAGSYFIFSAGGLLEKHLFQGDGPSHRMDSCRGIVYAFSLAL